MSLACTGCSPLLPSAWPTRTSDSRFASSGFRFPLSSLLFSTPPPPPPPPPAHSQNRRVASRSSSHVSAADRRARNFPPSRKNPPSSATLHLPFNSRQTRPESLVLSPSIIDDWLLDSIRRARSREGGKRDDELDSTRLDENGRKTVVILRINRGQFPKLPLRTGSPPRERSIRGPKIVVPILLDDLLPERLTVVPLRDSRGPCCSFFHSRREII